MARRSRYFDPHADHLLGLRRFDPAPLRGVLGQAFLTELVTDFKTKGWRLIPHLRKERPPDYLKLILALLPKTFRVYDVDVPWMSEEQLAALDQYLAQARAEEAQKRREAQQAQGGGQGTAGKDGPAS